MSTEAPATTDTFEVLEVDQHTSTGNVTSIPWDDLKSDGIDQIAGGDSEAVRRINGGWLHLKTVKAGAHPGLGYVWYRRGDDGFPQFYLADYDSSD